MDGGEGKRGGCMVVVMVERMEVVEREGWLMEVILKQGNEEWWYPFSCIVAGTHGYAYLYFMWGE